MSCGYWPVRMLSWWKSCPADDYEWAHLRGAVSLPLKQLDGRAEELDRSRPVIVYCHDSL